MSRRKEEPVKRRTVRLAFWARKGGVGKSFCSYNLAAVLANEGHRVLYIGFDSQEDVTNSILAATDDFDQFEHKSLRGVFEGLYPVSEAVVASPGFPMALIKETDGRITRKRSRAAKGTYTFDMIPAGDGLMTITDISIDDLYSMHNLMKEIEGAYDYIILDLPPSDAPFTDLALAYADHVFIPVSDSTGAASIDLCITKIKEMNSYGFTVQLSGVIINKYRAGKELDSYNASTLRDAWGDMVCRTVIPNSDSAMNAFALGLPLISYPYSTPLVPALYRLSREIQERIN